MFAIFGTIWYYFDTKFYICEFAMRAECPRVSKVLFGTLCYLSYYLVLFHIFVILFGTTLELLGLWYVRTVSKNCFHWHTIPTERGERENNVWQTNKINLNFKLQIIFLSSLNDEYYNLHINLQNSFQSSPLDRLSPPIKDVCMWILEHIKSHDLVSNSLISWWL